MYYFVSIVPPTKPQQNGFLFLSEKLKMYLKAYVHCQYSK